MNIVNLTPYRITVIADDKNRNPYVYEFLPSGIVARVSVVQTEVAQINEIIPIIKTEFGEVEGLPEPREDTLYIVSGLVAQALAGKRDDVITPDAGSTAYRDEDGGITAVRGFRKV